MKMKRRDILWNRGKQTFSINGKTINILGFAGPVLSVATTYSHHCSMKKKAIDNTQICASKKKPFDARILKMLIYHKECP